MKTQKPLIAITGASSGIGAATAKKFSKEGYPLLLMARRLEKMQSFNLPKTLCKQVDVRNLDQIRNAIQEAEEKFGPVNCLVNNAGIIFWGNFIDQTHDAKKQVVETNLMGVINGMEAVLKGMVQREKGTIINVSSVAGRRTSGGNAIYGGTKFAVHALTEIVRQEVSGKNVRLIVIAPGLTETEIFSNIPEAFKQRYHELKEETGTWLPASSIA
ncbi:SDR family oxidoreductase, partial [Xanthovirga aplysinae]|uniref:SDR family oxidoreductase n=1 Tax=Xanthovirga aplysinae TaxID=2529853 RepID=UPI0012BBBF28